MFFDGDGEAVDWILGYDPPADAFKLLLDKVLKGEGTFKSLMAAYAKSPKAVDTVFKLGRKYEDRYDMAKASEFYKKVVELDPKGEKGTTDYDTGRPGKSEKVSYTQYAEFNIGAAALSSRPPDPSAMRAFIKKYPDGEMVKAGYQRLSAVHFLRTAPKEDAAAFYAEWTSRFPKDTAALSAWVQRILQDKEPVDKGIELAAQAIALIKLEREAAAPGGAPGAVLIGPGGVILNASLELNLARLYALKGENDKAIATVDEAAKAAGDNARMIPGIAQAYLDIGAEDKALGVYGPAFLQRSLAAAAAITPYASFWARQDKNLDSALEAAKKAVEMNPNAFVGWTTLAQVYVKMKNAPEALKAADKALEVAPAAQKAIVQRMVDQIKTQAAAIK
jgi:tetratricopeptide (TPR) repeat protein